MPTYVYECTRCGQTIERTCPMRDHVRKIICACDGTATQIVAGVPAVRMGADFSDQNNGRGIWNGQVRDYVRSPSDLLEKGKRMGFKKL